MKVLVYAGSFDPVTLGHLDIIQRASVLCDKLVILVSCSQNKKYYFSAKQRLNFIKESTKHITNIESDTCDILLAKYMKQKSYKFLLRGIRSPKDFFLEGSMAVTNKILDKDLESVFLLSGPQYQHLSSSLIKELMPYEIEWKPFVPPCVLVALQEKKYE